MQCIKICYSSVTPAKEQFNRKNSNKRKGCSNLTVSTQYEKLRKICSMCCLLQHSLHGKTIKGNTTQKRKDKLEKEKPHELSITFCCDCAYCFDLMLWKNIIIIFFPKKLVTERKYFQNHCKTCTFTLMQTKKNNDFYTYASLVRLQVLICCVNTQLQRIFNWFC